MVDGSSIIRRFRLVFDGGAATAGPFEAPDPDQRYVFDLDAAIDASTVRMEAVETTGGNTGLKALERFAAP